MRAKAVCFCFCFHFSFHIWYRAQHGEEDGLSFNVCWICKKEKRLILCPILSNIMDLHQPFRNLWLGFSIIYSSQMPSQSFLEICPISITLQHFNVFQSVSSVTQSCPTLCNPMNHSTPGLPVHHQLPEFTQTHVHWVGDAIQPTHPLSPLSPPAPNPSQHQSLFQWVNSSHEVAKVLEFQL